MRFVAFVILIVYSFGLGFVGLADSHEPKVKIQSAHSHSRSHEHRYTQDHKHGHKHVHKHGHKHDDSHQHSASSEANVPGYHAGSSPTSESSGEAPHTHDIVVGAGFAFHLADYPVIELEVAVSIETSFGLVQQEPPQEPGLGSIFRPPIV